MHSLILRKKFLEFFKLKQHTIIPSSSLIPLTDPTLLFVNAGMVQFKEIFLGNKKSLYKRAASIQKCVRLNGKHDDLDNIGKTARHQTFFEMMGNFSFGDYDKETACYYAWEFLTKILKLEKTRLFFTIFSGDENLEPDLETEKIWTNLGVSPKQISKKGSADNFWTMGGTGPCGPCTEIFYDRRIEGDNADRFMEFWNIVFIQYNKNLDGSLNKLNKTAIDTGMGLERLCTIINNLSSNYECDLLLPLIKYCLKFNTKNSNLNNANNVSIKIIVDHARTILFLIADGILPSNEGRGYILRRLIRRSLRHIAQLGLKNVLLYDLCNICWNQYQDIYPNLLASEFLLKKILSQEEEIFTHTIKKGLEIFSKITASSKKKDSLNGSVIFKLYETYGFPVDLSEELAKEANLTIDWKGFKLAKNSHEKISSQNVKIDNCVNSNKYTEILKKFGETKFEEINNKTIQIIAILGSELVFDLTPFFAESGGQVGDTGVLENSTCKVQILQTKKINNLHIHCAKIIFGTIFLNDFFYAKIDSKHRQKITSNHSATHLLHSALIKKFGRHISQKGSLVCADKLRFDFSHHEIITPQELFEIELQVNKWILENCKVLNEKILTSEVKNTQTIALFEEKYEKEVNVVTIGKYSKELCCGTHVEATGSIGSFKIINESTIAFGVKRIEAITCLEVVKYTQKNTYILSKINKIFNVNPIKFPLYIEQINNENKCLQKEINNIKEMQLEKNLSLTIKNIKKINTISVIFEKLTENNNTQIKVYISKIKKEIKSGIVFILSITDKQYGSLYINISNDLTSQFNANSILEEIISTCGGYGGGKENFAQGEKIDIKKLDHITSNLELLIFKENN